MRTFNAKDAVDEGSEVMCPICQNPIMAWEECAIATSSQVKYLTHLCCAEEECEEFK